MGEPGGEGVEMQICAEGITTRPFPLQDKDEHLELMDGVLVDLLVSKWNTYVKFRSCYLTHPAAPKDAEFDFKLLLQCRVANNAVMP